MARSQNVVIPEGGSVARWNADLAFRAVFEATSDKAGLDFMRHLVKNLAQALHVEYAFVAEFAGAEDRVKTIAFWSGDDWRSNVEYRLGGTPCERVVAGSYCLYKDDVQRLFPEDSDLVALRARSYLGVPLQRRKRSDARPSRGARHAPDGRRPARARDLRGVREPSSRGAGAAPRRDRAPPRRRRPRGATREHPPRSERDPAEPRPRLRRAAGAARDQPVLDPPPASRGPLRRARALREAPASL